MEQAFVSFLFYLLLVLAVRELLKSDAHSTDIHPGQPARARASDTVWAFLVYTLLAAAFFYQIIPRLNSSLIGPPEDNMQHLWDVWWARQALQGRLDFLHTARVFYPEGGSLLFYPFSSYNLLVALALGSVPPVATYNLLILSSFVLAGVGAFLLARHVTNDTPAALLGGFIFAFSPMHFAHSLHHIEIASIQFIPFFVLYYLKVLEGNSKRDVVWASVFFLLNSLCSWYYMFSALLCMAACYWIAAFRRKRVLMPRPIVTSLVIAGVSFAILSPLIMRMLQYALLHPAPRQTGYARLSVDVLGLFVPHYYHWLARIPFVERMNGSYLGFPWETVGYLGIFSLLLVVASYRARAARAARYTLGLLFFLVLAFGTRLHFLGLTIASALPYGLIRQIPVLSDARAPGRMMVFVYLFVAVLVALAFSHQIREGWLRKRRWVAALIAAGMFADFWTPCREVTPVRLPPAYTAIRAREPTADFGILDLPGGNDRFCARYMMYQTLHGLPLVQGYLGTKKRAELSLIDRLEWNNLPVQKEQLRSARVKYIVVHKQLSVQKAGDEDGLDLARYEDEYQEFFEDDENLVLRVY